MASGGRQKCRRYITVAPTATENGRQTGSGTVASQEAPALRMCEVAGLTAPATNLLLLLTATIAPRRLRRHSTGVQQ